MNGLDRPAGIYRIDARGQRVCRLCEALDTTHAPGCPVVTMDAHVRELTAQVGFIVAAMFETTEALNRLLRGDAGDGT